MILSSHNLHSYKYMAFNMNFVKKIIRYFFIIYVTHFLPQQASLHSPGGGGKLPGAHGVVPPAPVVLRDDRHPRALPPGHSPHLRCGDAQ